MNNIINEFSDLWNIWLNSDLIKLTACSCSVIYTIYNINKMLTDEKYTKRPMLCYVSTFTLSSITSPYMGAIIGYCAPISFPIILLYNHYPLIKKNIKG